MFAGTRTVLSPKARGQMKIETKIKPGHILVALKGNFDAGWTAPTAGKISRILDETAGEEGLEIDLIIDMSELNYISSGGLSILLAFHKRMKNAGRQMVLCNPSSMVSDLLTMTGMYGVFQIQPSVGAAIKTLDRL